MQPKYSHMVRACMCMYVCMYTVTVYYIYMYLYMYLYMYMYMYTYTYLYMYMICVCVYIHMCSTKSRTATSVTAETPGPAGGTQAQNTTNMYVMYATPPCTYLFCCLRHQALTIHMYFCSERLKTPKSGCVFLVGSPML